MVGFRLPDDETRSGRGARRAAAGGAATPSSPTSCRRWSLIAGPGEEGMAVVGDGTITEPGRYAVVCAIPIGADPAESARRAPMQTDVERPARPRRRPAPLHGRHVRRARSSPSLSRAASRTGRPIAPDAVGIGRPVAPAAQRQRRAERRRRAAATSEPSATSRSTAARRGASHSSGPGPPMASTTTAGDGAGAGRRRQRAPAARGPTTRRRARRRGCGPGWRRPRAACGRPTSRARRGPPASRSSAACRCSPGRPGGGSRRPSRPACTGRSSGPS